MACGGSGSGGSGQDGVYWDKYRDKRISCRYRFGSDEPLERSFLDTNNLPSLFSPDPVGPVAWEGTERGAIPKQPSLRSQGIRMSKDAKLAREANIRFTINQIVGLPMDEFNDMLSKEDLTEEQLNICRDIRRRGKNKVAAQNCRRRKIDQIEELREKIAQEKANTIKIKADQERQAREYQEVADELMKLHDEKLVEHGYSPETHTLEITPDKKVLIVRKDEATNSIIPEKLEDLLKEPTKPTEPPGNCRYWNNY